MSSPAWWFDTGELSAFVVDGLLLVSAAVYLAGVRRLGARGRAWSPARSLAWMAGLLALFVAVGSRLAVFDDVSPPLHAIQHLLLMMIGPPLLCLGRPGVLAAQAGGRRLQRAVVRSVNHPAVRASGGWSWPAYYGVMAVCLLPPFYRVEVTNEPVHECTHAVLVLLGLAYWQGIVERPVTRRPGSLVRRLLPLLVGMPVEAALGFALMEMSRPLTASTLAATHQAGQIFWMASMGLTGVAVAVIVLHWVQTEERRAQAAEARRDLSVPPGAAAASREG